MPQIPEHSIIARCIVYSILQMSISSQLNISVYPSAVHISTFPSHVQLKGYTALLSRNRKYCIIDCAVFLAVCHLEFQSVNFCIIVFYSIALLKF